MREAHVVSSNQSVYAAEPRKLGVREAAGVENETHSLRIRHATGEDMGKQALRACFFPRPHLQASACRCERIDPANALQGPFLQREVEGRLKGWSLGA